MSSVFGSLLTDQVKTTGIPAVLFTDNADLRNTIRRVVAKSDDIEVSNENIIPIIDQYDALENNKLENEAEFEIFHKIADAFAKRLHEGIETLHSVHKTVEELTDKINEHAAMRIAEDSTLSKVFNIERDVKMEDVKWDILNIVDERDLREMMHAAIKFDTDRETTPSMVDLIINKMAGANEYNEVTIQKIDIPQDKFVEIVDKIHAAFPEESREMVAGYFRNILNMDIHAERSAVRAAKDFADGKSADKINTIMQNVAGFYKVLSMLTADNLNLAQSTMVELEKHIDVVQGVVNTMAYICFYYRNNVWKDAIMVPGPLCNRDNMEDFEGQGGSDKHLVQHHTKFYDGVKVPTKGISGNFVMQSAKHTEEEFSTEAAKHAMQINEKKAEIDRGAFVICATNYLNSHRDKLSKKFNNTNFAEYAHSIYSSMGNQSVEAKLYRLIMGAEHIGTIVPQLYNRLNDAYVKYTEQVGSLSEAACEELDIAVYSDMIAEYLVDQGILVI